MLKSQKYYELKQAIRLLKEVKNPFNSFLFYIGIKNQVTVKTKKIGEFNFDSTQQDICHSLLLTLPYLEDKDKKECKYFFNQCSNNNQIIELNDYKVNREFCGVFAEKFTEFPYNFSIEDDNGIVIDIGSHVGDTALEFANRGFTVYGFEPVKELFEISQKNVGLNPHLSDKINLFNYGVSYKKGTISIDSMGSTSEYIDSGDSYEVEVVTIEDIIEKNEIQPKFLKMDCEGCEFDIIQNTDLSNFKEIILEHHAGIVNKKLIDLTENLKKQGFKIELIPLWTFDMEYVGIVRAYK